jgi:hypothetical protein
VKARPPDYISPHPPNSPAPHYSYWPAGVPVVVALGVAFVEAGSSGGMLAYRLIIDGILAVVWTAAMTGIGWGFAKRLPVPLLLRFVSGTAIGIGIVSLLVLGLGLLGWLNIVTAWAILIIGIGLGAWQIRASSLPPSPGTPGEGGVMIFSSPPTRGSFAINTTLNWSWLWLLLLPFLGLAIVGAITPPGILWQDEPAGYDVSEYHLQLPREWYEAGKIQPLHHNVFSYMPMNVEMHDLLAMHLRRGPWAGMYLAQFIHLAIMVLAVLAAAGVAGALSDKPWAAPLAGVAMGVTPWITSLAPVAYNEGGLMLFGGLAMGWAILARDWRGWLVAGVMAGLACGVKLTAGPMVGGAIVVAWGVDWVARVVGRAPQAEPLKGLKFLIVFVFSSAILFAPWMIRNQVWAGNALFPEAMGVLGKGHFSEAQVTRWRDAHSPTKDEKTLTGRVVAAWERIAIDWRYGFLFLPLAIAAIAMARDRQTTFLAVLLLVQGIVWIGFTHLQGRFFILALPIGAMLIGIVRVPAWRWIAGSTIVIIAAVGFFVLNERYTLVRQFASNGLLGAEDLKWIIELRSDINVDKLPADKPIILVGDAEAFFYSGIPMSRLNYRTVFDAPGTDGGDWLEKWTGGTHGTVVVFPGELLRFKKTYDAVPTPAEEKLRNQKPFTLDR